MSTENLPLVVADGPLAEAVTSLMDGKVQTLPWSTTEVGHESVEAIYTYGHLTVNGEIMDRFPKLKLISNYGVGVDHIVVEDATARNLPVGNTPNVLNGATADMAMCLLLASARRLSEGDRYAKGPEFTTYDPGYMLGVEIHSQTIGIVGLGRIGEQIAKRARGFDMNIVYHNRKPKDDLDPTLDARYVSLDELLEVSDFVVLSTPLTSETTGLIDKAAFEKMKSTAILVNVARGGVVVTSDLNDALRSGQIYAAGLDVTDPEPLPREHPLLELPNVTIAPHLGSATQQTRQKMAEISVENLLLGLAGKPLKHRVN